MKLQEILEIFEKTTDQSVRSDFLVDFADRFSGIPESVATRPYPKTALVPGCESEAYVMAKPAGEGMELYLAVENPQGLSAKGLAVILSEGLAGASCREIAGLNPELVYTIFGRSLSMGKGAGLMGMVNMVRAQASSLMERGV